ncbi:MAG TPA: alpha/beta fold hydrolase, partial [Hyphomonadaceae bacterium]|nr:alpha/beta fold hydrolase [Hyphomonadaceae bacterium]
KSFGAVMASLAVVVGIVAAAKGFSDDGDIQPAISEITAGQLHGTLVDKRHKDPVVLIVPGSGPTDRDGNSPAGVDANSYKLLAEALIAEDIASVRIDKRGLFGSAGAGDPNITSPQAYVDDIHAWIDAIKAERGSKCVFLLGHSEGALLVSLAAEGRKDVCGLILVSGVGHPLGDVLREQFRSNPANAPILDAALHAIDELEQGRTVDVTTLHPALARVFSPGAQPYLISLMRIDPVEAVRRAKKPTLVVQGTRDIQVSVEDARLLNKAPKTELKLVNDMNHVLKEAPADRAGNIATYTNPSLPLATDFVNQIEEFIEHND